VLGPRELTSVTGRVIDSVTEVSSF
jgi:hypothetical protein